MIWLHGDHLSADNPALLAHPDAPVVFVFDEEFLAAEGFAFHRLFFLYESVLDLFATRKERGSAGRCSVRRGRVPEEVIAFASECGARRVVTTATLGGRFAAYKAEIAARFPVEAILVPSLVPYEARNVPKRFSVWWRQVEEEALRP